MASRGRHGYALRSDSRQLGRKSHHPIVAVLAEMPFVLHAWLRSRNTVAGRGVASFLKEPLALNIFDVRAILALQVKTEGCQAISQIH